MLKFLTTLVQEMAGGASRATTAACASGCMDWLRDPLAHPAVNAMSLAELADLPAGQLRARLRD
jgi:hypothetical protein